MHVLFLFFFLHNLSKALRPVPHKLIKSIRTEYKTSRDKCPNNFRLSDTPSLSSVQPFSITSHHDTHPFASSGFTCATRLTLSPSTISNDRDRKSRQAFVPTVLASSSSQHTIWLATLSKCCFYF